MNIADMIEVFCTADPSQISDATALLAREKISCIAHGWAQEDSFPVRFLVPPQLADRARSLLGAS